MTETLSFTEFGQLLRFFFVVIFFHGSEYILVAAIHGKDRATFSSLLISTHYVLAMTFSLIEYFGEIYYFPGLKDLWLASYMGLALVVVGEIIRKLAIITAGRSFTHLIKIYYDEQHKLVTHGIYACTRHPSYCGFFIWAIGTQVLLCNPLSTLVFAVVLWCFFHGRIPYEEFFLRQFFGHEYDEYARRTPSGIPFIK